MSRLKVQLLRGALFMKKWKLKELVRAYRTKGLSYKEINRKTGLAKSTLSLWCKDIELSPKQRQALGLRYDNQLRGAKANKVKRQLEIDKIQSTARSEIAVLSLPEFKIAGLMLYWAEGNKTLYPGIANSDPKLITIMMKWFREICHVPEDKFKIHLHLHSGQDEGKIKRFWSQQTGIPLIRFGESHIKKEGSGHRKNILYFGTAKIGIYTKDLLYKILGWIDAFKDLY